MSPALIERAIRASCRRIDELEKQSGHWARHYVWVCRQPVGYLVSTAPIEARHELFAAVDRENRERARFARLYDASKERRSRARRQQRAA